MKRAFLVIALFATILIGQSIEGNHNRIPPCATEDSDNCYWNAETMGNGKGQSFIVINGKVTYK